MRDISFHYGQEPLYSCFFGIPEFLAETNKRCNPRSSNLQINPKPGKKAYRRKKERHSCVCVCVSKTRQNPRQHTNTRTQANKATKANKGYHDIQLYPFFSFLLILFVFLARRSINHFVYLDVLLNFSFAES